MKQSEVKQLNGLALAYMGDAVLEIFVRRYLIEQGKVRPQKLHQAATRYVSAKAQAKVVRSLFDNEGLTDEEYGIVMRGRNAKSHSAPKNTDMQTYRLSTGFEALIGFLYLRDEKERLQSIIEYALNVIEEGNENCVEQS